MVKVLSELANRCITSMNISILCSDPNHPVVNSLREWQSEMVSKDHLVNIVYDKAVLIGGDILFLVSCSEIIDDQERSKFKHILVLHASDVPKGRGWSPHVWDVINGANELTVSLLEANYPVDTGRVWFKTNFSLEGHELLPEINSKLFAAELNLMRRAVEEFLTIYPTPQLGEPSSYRRKRTPADSRLDPNKTIAEQFDLLRVVDSERYPAFFDYRGKRYMIRIEKIQNEG